MGEMIDRVSSRLRSLIKFDEFHHDNLVFKLHHQVNFFFILVGVLFIFGENYLNGTAITCLGANDYANKYCWLHGTGHVHKDLAKEVTGLCAMDLAKGTDRPTSYYIWLPFLLAICMGLVKLPRVVWKNLCERGLMKNMVGDNKEDAAYIVKRFKKSKKRSGQYLVLFAFCELLNFVMLIVCFLIMDSLLNENFWRYGADVRNYYSSAAKETKANPMCNLFPTEVACNVCTGAIGSGCDWSSHLCILSNNLFNQYFFLVLWFWWILLLVISVLGLTYRLAQIFINPFSKRVLQAVYLAPYNLEQEINELSLSSSEYFLLGRLAINIKGSTLEKVIEGLKSQVRSQNEATRLISVGSNNHINVNQEDGVPMLPLARTDG